MPPTWKDVRNTLKHKKEEIDLTQLVTHLLIEVGIREQEKVKDPSSVPTVNMVGENSNKSKFVKNKKRGSNSFKGKSTKSSKKPTVDGCWFCGKPDHRKKDCFLFKKKNGNKGEASTSEDPMNEGTSSQLIKFNSNLDLNGTSNNICCVQDDSWYMDSGASRHVCMDRRWFKTFHKCDGDEFLYMGNNSSIQILGKGSVDLHFTSGNLLTLKEVMFAPKIARNLVSGPTLNRMGYKLVFESD